MWRGEQADPQSCRAINAFEHRARRAFAVGAGDVDKAEFILRIASQRGELECVFQPKVRAENLQAVEKLDGFGVGHRSTVNVMSYSVLSEDLASAGRS